MRVENNNLILTVINKKLIYALSCLFVLSLIIIILFFTIINPEYIVLGLPFAFFVLVLPIFIIGMRNKIIYRFTLHELQFRSNKPINIKWQNIKSYSINNNQILIVLKNDSNISLPILNFNPDEIKKVLDLYIK